MNNRPLAILVDGSGFIYRAYYALPQLTDGQGRSVGAVYGFCSMLISLLKKHESDLFCVVMDSGRDTFRSEIYQEYKANRSETPEELKSQMPLLRDACDAFGVPVISKKGFEADDIIATFARKLPADGYDVRIISSDKDLMQLVTDTVTIFDPMKSRIIKAEQVNEKYGVAPSQMIFLQTLMGDPSDNIPGVKGIGLKTAAKLVAEFQTLDALYQNINKIKSPKIRESLIEQRDRVDISLKLVTLREDVELDYDLKDLKISHNVEKSTAFLTDLGFNTLVKRISQRKIDARSRVSITSMRELLNFFELNRIQKFSFFFSSCADGRNVLATCCGTQTAFCIFSMEDNLDLFSQNITLREICNSLKPYLENPSIKKIGIKNELRYFKNIELQSYDDLHVMAYLLHGTFGDEIGSLFPGNDDSICKMSFKNVCEIEQICKISELIYDAYDEVTNDLKKHDLLKIYDEIDQPLINILKNMEENGITVSIQKLNELSAELSEKIKELENKIFVLAGCKFNIGSVNQLSDVLFCNLNIPKPKKMTSLDAAVLEELSEHSPIIGMIIQWRQLTKLLTSYTVSLGRLADPKTCRVHTTFNMTATVTGRLSSSNPNLQNIPHSTEYGRRVREAFVSKSGYQLVSFDYSQIELRILSHIANIDSLQETFINGQDVHTITAAGIFGIDLQEVTKEMRSCAKVINFGIIYGMSSQKLSQVLCVSQDEARSYIENYLRQFPGFEKYKEDTLEFARKHGYVQTLTGRRCYTKDIVSANYSLSQFTERQALNATIQGSAADIVKIAMINVFPKLSELNSKMLIQVHDELVFETKDEFVEQSILVIKKIMENVMKLSVPLEVNVKFGTRLR
ncbi:MAG: DNA polymerase I [Holosporaceae bacterium]|jgi:DNA polymerase-1|nr:DNA polymerase I [Holosporaceae bacterium]